MTTASPATAGVTTTYLHIPRRADFRPAVGDHPGLSVRVPEAPSVPFYRSLYDAVGRHHRWVDRLAWSDDELEAYLGRASVTLLVAYLESEPVGYVELDRGPHAAEPGTEIVYFGLVPSAQGRGFGKHVLSLGVTRAFDDGAERVWVHTCTLDGPHALATYRGRGFVPYKTLIEGTPATLPGPAKRTVDEA